MKRGLLSLKIMNEYIEVRLNLQARLSPEDRFEIEDAIDEMLQRGHLGEVTGGGTLMSAEGEPEECDVDMNLIDKAAVEKVSAMVNRMGVPKGSSLIAGDDSFTIPVGTLEGLAFYANGAELSPELYQAFDINQLLDDMEKAMGGAGRIYSHWVGPVYLGVYFYGESYSEMYGKIKAIVSSHPLCQKCRIEQIA